MARTRRKKALYEVIGRGQLKQGQSQAFEKPPPDEPPAARAESETDASPAALEWPKKPRIVQINAGRIEFSIPYQAAVAAVLVLILLLLMAYKLGQVSQSDAAALDETGKTPPSEVHDVSLKQAGPDSQRQPEQPKAVAPAAVDTGDNVIVLVEYQRRADLVPVQKHFRTHGIETEIAPAPGGKYYLWTKNRYSNVNTQGTPGYREKQRIKEVGALYKAPPSYETFAPNYFSDAYGKYVGQQ
jgi:hypothetical protein